jgi:16S rRNA (adenine1518-N6/adenine1519-N6)-dimethyltransferase
MSPRPRLGQNFLVDTSVAEGIVDLAAVDGAQVVEIGPGRAALTDMLATRAAGLHLIEIDEVLAQFLRDRYAERPHVEVICADVMTWDWSMKTEERVKVVSNLPYESGTAVVFQLLDNRDRIAEATLMLQKEVSQRIAASPGCKAWGRLGVMSQMFADVSAAMIVPPTAFSPRPKVESQVFQMRFLEEARFEIGSREVLEAVLAKAFSNRRKMLRNNLGGFLRGRLGEGQDQAVFDAASIDPTLRPEAIDLEGWARISFQVWRRMSAKT